MSLLARAAASIREQRSVASWGPYSDGRIPPPTWDGTGDTGTPVTETTTMSLVDAYACVGLVSDSYAMLPVGEYENRGEVREPVLPPAQIITQPDPELEGWEWRSQMATSLALRGNAYSVHLAWSRNGFPISSRCVHPDDIRPGRNRDTGRLQYVLRNGVVLDPHEVMHVPWVKLPGALVGLSPIECARRGIRMSIATEQFGDRWFSDGATPSSVLETDQDLDDDQSRRQQAKWVAAHRNRRRPAVLTGGLKWRPITIAPNESQFIESRKLNTSQIARIWRVPPHMIGDVEKTTSWGTGIEEQGIGFTVFTLGAYLFRMEAAMSRHFSPGPRYVKHNVSALLRGNTRDRYLSYAIARQWGWMSVNDIRRLEDLPPVDGGDVYLQPLNMVDAEKALQILLTPKGGAPA